jgi:hypothetical protein
MKMRIEPMVGTHGSCVRDVWADGWASRPYQNSDVLTLKRENNSVVYGGSSSLGDFVA